MNRIFFAFAALICLTGAGCCCNSLDETENLQQSAEVKNNKLKIDNFIKSYIQPEHEIPTVYAPEWKSNPDYKEIAELTKQAYKNLTFFLQSENLNSLSLTYATGDVKKSFIISAANKNSKLSLLCRDEDKVMDLFKAEAEMPEITVMPKGIPANLEDVIIREMHMIHSILLAPNKLAKAVSLDIVPMMNIAKKTTSYEKKEFLINNRLCYKLEIQLRDMFGGGMIRIYADGQDIIQIEIPTMTLDINASSAFVVTIDDYQKIDKFQIPSSFVFRKERFLLKENKINN
ncbi:MAG: hypothetical protein IKB16_04875 [Lentisphaeria bacterium]|nr:hypothetical protein [Lentisphaeria bacterium]